MKGLKIFFNGEETDVSSDFGVSLVIVLRVRRNRVRPVWWVWIGKRILILGLIP